MNDLLNHFNQSIKRSGKVLIIEGKSINGIIKEIIDGTNGIDTKELLTSEPLNQGDILSYNSNNYMVVTKNQSVNEVYGSYTLRECPYIVKFVFDGVVKSFDMFTDKQAFDIGTPTAGGIGIIPTNKIFITIKNTVDTNGIALNKRFIKFGSPWKITGIDKTIKGIIAYTCDFDFVGEFDDLINEIAYESTPIVEPEVPVDPVVSTFRIVATPSTFPSQSRYFTTTVTLAVLNENDEDVTTTCGLWMEIHSSDSDKTKIKKEITTNTGFLTGFITECVNAGACEIIVNLIDGNTYETVLTYTIPVTE